MIGEKDGIGRAASSARKRRGFAYIESLMAGAVFVIAAVGVAAAIAQGSGIAERTKERTRAWAVLRELHSRLTADEFSKVAEDFHRSAFAVPGMTAVDGDPDGLPGSVVFEEIPGTVGCYLVHAEIRWQSAGRDYAVQARYFIGNVYDDRKQPPTLASIESQPTLSGKVKTVDVTQ